MIFSQKDAGAALHPAVLEHAAALIGHSPWEVSRDLELLCAAHARAHEIYGHSPVIAGIDVYHAEVEAWGVEVRPAAHHATPALGGPLFDDPLEVLRLPSLDLQRDGRLPLLLGAAARLIDACPGAEVRVPLAGPFSVLVGLLGFETLLMELADGGGGIRDAIAFLARRQAALCRAVLTRGFQPVIYESGAAPPLVSPEMFRSIVAPALRIVMQAGRDAATPLACILGGNVASVADALLEAGPGAVICPAETDQAAFIEVARAWPETSVRINLPASSVGSGNRAAFFAAIEERIPLVARHPRAVLGTGVVPFDADPDFIRAGQQYAAALLAECSGTKMDAIATPHRSSIVYTVESKG